MKQANIKIIFSILISLILIVAYYAHERNKQNQIDAREKVENDRLDRQIIDMARNQNADYKWKDRIKEISEKQGDNLMSYQVENILSKDQPILGIGEIEDIQIDKEGYKLIIKSIESYEPSIGFEIRFIINCEKSATETAQEIIKTNKESYKGNDVAFVVKTSSVKSGLYWSADKTVYGECLSFAPSTNNHKFRLP